MLVCVAVLASTLLLSPWTAAQQPGTTQSAGGAASSSALSLEQYAQELARLKQRVESGEHISKEDARALSGSLPVFLDVRADGKDYQVSLYFLHDALAKAASDDKQWQSARLGVIATLSALEEEVLPSTTPNDFSTAHGRAETILASREFRAVHGPTWWDQVKAKIFGWFYRLLAGIFKRIGPWPSARYFVYGIALAILLVFAWWVWRMLPHRELDPPLSLSAPAISAKHWARWLGEARAAAQAGSWRDAVHLSYWAGISFLEAGGLWRPDRARTPREYLKLLPDAASERGTLQSMTREFERAWYAQQAAGSDDFERMLLHLKSLGCQV